jgi:hypothetical protein
MVQAKPIPCTEGKDEQELSEKNDTKRAKARQSADPIEAATIKPLYLQAGEYFLI